MFYNWVCKPLNIDDQYTSDWGRRRKFKTIEFDNNKFLIIEEMRTGKLVKLKYDCFIGCGTNLGDLCLMNW